MELTVKAKRAFEVNGSVLELDGGKGYTTGYSTDFMVM